MSNIAEFLGHLTEADKDDIKKLTEGIDVGVGVFSVMIKQAFGPLAKDTELFDIFATGLKNMVDALVRADFSREEALHIVLNIKAGTLQSVKGAKTKKTT